MTAKRKAKIIRPSLDQITEYVDYLHIEKARAEAKLRKAVKSGKRWEAEYWVYECLKLEAKLENFEGGKIRCPEVDHLYHVFKGKNKTIIVVEDGQKLPNLPYASISDMIKNRTFVWEENFAKRNIAIVVAHDFRKERIQVDTYGNNIYPPSSDKFSIARKKAYSEQDRKAS